jgi:hypothetical protein
MGGYIPDWHIVRSDTRAIEIYILMLFVDYPQSRITEHERG